MGKRAFVRTALIGTALIASACMEPHRVMFVYRAPPAEVVETIPPSPGADYVWVRGHYRWDGAGYVWIRGHWQQAPAGYREWVPGHWVQRRDGAWFWVDGHWR